MSIYFSPSRGSSIATMQVLLPDYLRKCYKPPSLNAEDKISITPFPADRSAIPIKPDSRLSLQHCSESATKIHFFLPAPQKFQAKYLPSPNHRLRHNILRCRNTLPPLPAARKKTCWNPGKVLPLFPKSTACFPERHCHRMKFFSHLCRKMH